MNALKYQAASTLTERELLFLAHVPPVLGLLITFSKLSTS